MQDKNYTKLIATRACIYYTVTTLALVFLSWLISGDASLTLHPLALVLTLPFSAFFASANIIFRFSSYGMGLKLLFHFLLTFSGVIFFLYLPNMPENQKASGALLFFIFLFVVYVIVMGIIIFLKRRSANIKRDSNTYTGVYKNK